MSVSQLTIVSYKKKSATQLTVSFGGLSLSLTLRPTFKLQLNPTEIKVNRSVGNVKDTPNADGSPASSKAIPYRPANYTFSFTLDNTGVVKKSLPKSSGIADSIKKLEDMTIIPDDDEHQTPFVRLFWGNSFKNSDYCQVESLSYDYTFFDTKGNPLRAKVNLTLKEVSSQSDRGFRSPDITKMEVVNEKDNLVRLSLKGYDDKKYYIRLAEVNNLCSIRSLSQGQTIILPPIKK